MDLIMARAIGCAIVACGSRQDASTATFNEWAQQRGVLFPKLRTARFDGGLRGMEAAQSLKAGDVAVQLPRTSALLIEPITKGPTLCPSEVWKRQPWFVKLALKLMLERVEDEDSYYAGYVLNLPAKADIPFFWPGEDLQDLRYPPLIHSIQLQKREWQQYADALARDAPDLKLDRELFLSSMSLVRSRSFSGPYIGSKLADRIRLGAIVFLLAAGNVLLLGPGSIQQTLNAVLAVSAFNVLYDVFLSQRLKVYLLAPGVDFMNHSCAVQCDLSYDYFSDGYSVRLDRDYDAGDQVFISYGNKSNDDLLQYFGFIESDNPYDFVCVEKGILKLYHLFEEMDGNLSLSTDVPPTDVNIYREGFDPFALETLSSWFRKTTGQKDNISQVLIEFCQREITNLEVPSDHATGDRKNLIAHFKREKISILEKCIKQMKQQKV